MWLIAWETQQIGYAMNHADEHEWSEGIATLEKREDIIGHLISEID